MSKDDEEMRVVETYEQSSEDVPLDVHSCDDKSKQTENGEESEEDDVARQSAPSLSSLSSSHAT